MRETRADTTQAVIAALLLHALLFALMFIGLFWTRSSTPVSVAGSPVAAELIDANALSPAMQRTLRDRPKPVEEEIPPPPEPEDVAPLPQPLPEPAPQDAVAPPQQQAQDFIPVPDTENQEAVVETPTPTPAEEKKAQELKRKQEQVDLTEQKRQQEVEQQRRLAAQQEEERQQKLAEIRKKREQAAREANLAEQRLRQIADVRARQSSETSPSSGSDTASPPPGNNGTDTGLKARYAAALQEAILAKWTRPETVPVGARCTLQIRQLPGGQVMSAEVSSPCAYDEQGRRSIEAAVLKAQPLPYAGFESVFSRNLTLNFTAQDR
ncbi:cell envelope integrity protein TolA [Lysobacter auxotrophicus]|uniref:Cell envelope integrity protein TolA n=1 Tax=Lysobacter auxotrophicus TaxID=2992573 RepID=A0ABM8DAK9_9GAMM|nr:cell envelope integrity protein TolA [Lysobacter auxotrophicus]BDU15607.1 cell envelope integrity protein TolA [Lysobacter auxotrophicus]